MTDDALAETDALEYLEMVDVVESDIVLDIGAHIGMFARACLQRGARVIAVEPAPANLEQLRQNAAGARIIGAAVAQQEGEGLLYEGARSLDYSIVWENAASTPVSLLSFDKLLREIQPSYVKSDAEGAELTWSWKLPESVQTVIIEFHVMEDEDNARVDHVIQTLGKQGLVWTSEWRAGPYTIPTSNSQVHVFQQVEEQRKKR